jgi:hypothetical protein
MPVPILCAIFHLTFFFLGSAYLDGVPLLQYSAPVVKATLDNLKVYHCGVVAIPWSPLGSLTLTFGADLG